MGKLTLMVLLLLLVLPGIAIAQEPEPAPVLYRIVTTDGNEFVGEILEENDEFILFKTERLGQITINKKDIRSIEKLDARNLVQGEVWADNPQATRYFFAPNGYGLKKGEGYYQNVWIFINQVSIGVTDNFSLGAGMVPLFLFAGGSTPVWIIPKFSIPLVENKFNLGAGGLLGTVLGEGSAGFGFLYGLGTVGTRNRNASLGLGYGFAGGDWSRSPLINFSYMSRVGKNGYFLTENYFFSFSDDTLGLVSFGGRSIIRSIGLDYGAFVPVSPRANEFIIIPWLGLTVPFGNR